MDRREDCISRVGSSQRQAGSSGGSRNSAAATHSGWVRCTENGCFLWRDWSARNVGVTPGETQDARKVGVSPGETIDAQKTGFPQTRRILCVWIINGLLLYKIGISANSQEVFSMAHGSPINPIKRHPCWFCVYPKLHIRYTYTYTYSYTYTCTYTYVTFVVLRTFGAR